MCLFCDFAEKKIPIEIVCENEHVFCIRDIKPVAPVHVLLITKKHYDDVLALANAAEAGDVMLSITKAISDIVDQLGLESGFRLINNCRENGGQTIMHTHIHVIGQTKLSADII